eukprot:CAMPEP_0183351904 /NCGR_PEP_ID=MMETSP0164_2-20130417/26328_1 /TAXON_ID=221442 /ORGANISM="Coccolithus pelagicus ssp braarudi, Strain PLY182g" /LENGTH=116 /DNA_ID=CAMNT_0025524205 /DNA_START=41 /DNA_END=391 /DNA_ORIENTATION=+
MNFAGVLACAVLVVAYTVLVSGSLHSLIEESPSAGVSFDRRTGKRLVEWVMYGRLHAHYSGEGMAAAAILSVGGVSLIGMDRAANTNAPRLVILCALLAALSLGSYVGFADHKMPG